VPIKSFRIEYIAISSAGVEGDPFAIKSDRKTTANLDVKRHHLRSGDVGRRKKGREWGRDKREREREREREKARERERATATNLADPRFQVIKSGRRF